MYLSVTIGSQDVELQLLRQDAYKSYRELNSITCVILPAPSVEAEKFYYSDAQQAGGCH